jgi:hypothetical protein
MRQGVYSREKRPRRGRDAAAVRLKGAASLPAGRRRRSWTGCDEALKKPQYSSR